MAAATQIFYSAFDRAFFQLPEELRSRVENKIDELGLRLNTFPHHRLTGSNRYRLRVGDYRIIYTFDTSQDSIHLLAIGHRREIYRDF
jgi:mRNA interferase RelE/StbE